MTKEEYDKAMAEFEIDHPGVIAWAEVKGGPFPDCSDDTQRAYVWDTLINHILPMADRLMPTGDSIMTAEQFDTRLRNLAVRYPVAMATIVQKVGPVKVPELETERPYVLKTIEKIAAAMGV